VITIKTGGRNGDVVCAKEVRDDNELIVTSVKGMVIRMPVSGISLLGRATMGVRLMRLKEGDKVTAVTRLLAESEEQRMVEAGRTLTSCPAPNGDAVDEGGEDGEREAEDAQEEGPKDDAKDE
jgi:DNA gyrase subunit A